MSFNRLSSAKAVVARASPSVKAQATSLLIRAPGSTCKLLKLICLFRRQRLDRSEEQIAEVDVRALELGGANRRHLREKHGDDATLRAHEPVGVEYAAPFVVAVEGGLRRMCGIDLDAHPEAVSEADRAFAPELVHRI